MSSSDTSSADSPKASRPNPVPRRLFKEVDEPSAETWTTLSSNGSPGSTPSRPQLWPRQRGEPGVRRTRLARVDEVREFASLGGDFEYGIAGGPVAVTSRRHDERRLACVVDVLLPRAATFLRIRVEDGGIGSSVDDGG